MLFTTDIGIDLGTSSVLIHVKGKGVVLKEPTVIAFDKEKNVIRAIGEEARLMLGKTPENIEAIRPIRQGVISDYAGTERMLKYFIQKAIGRKSYMKPRITVAVPASATEVERKAVDGAVRQTGAREVVVMDEPIAAALGSGIDITKPCGNMIIDIGGGTTDIAVISLGGIVVNDSIKIGGDDFNESIIRYMRRKHNLLIGDRTAEDIKLQIGTVFEKPQPQKMDVRGRNIVTGLPKTIEISSDEIIDPLIETAEQIVESLHGVLEKTPPELAADIAERGIVLAGGGALLDGMEQLIQDHTGMNTVTAEDPMLCVALGTGHYAQILDEKKKKQKDQAYAESDR